MSEKPPEPKSKKQPLYLRMFFDPAYVDFVRFIGYAGKPLEEAHNFLLEMEAKYGRPKTIEAGEAVSKAEGKQESMTVHLTAEARRLARGLLGPPPGEPPLCSAAEMVGKPDQPQPAPTKSKRKRGTAAPPKDDKGQTPGQIEEGTKEAARTVLGGKNRMPMLEQYRATKEQHPGMVLLFRMGDFYEIFEDDAKLAARELGLTLTTRDKTVAMAGFPHHALEAHLKKLLKAGHRVAVCEQVVESSSVQRDVTRVVTP